MAAVKAKKTSSKKLKAGQKKKTSKWLIIGGIAAVAVIGAVVVRFSSASQWKTIRYGDRSVTTVAGGSANSNMIGFPGSTTLTKGHTYRFCVRGFVNKGKTNVRLNFYMWDLNGKTIGERAIATKQYGTSSALHCTAEFKATKASYRVVGNWQVAPGGPAFTATSGAIQYLP